MGSCELLEKSLCRADFKSTCVIDLGMNWSGWLLCRAPQFRVLRCFIQMESVAVRKVLPMSKQNRLLLLELLRHFLYPSGKDVLNCHWWNQKGSCVIIACAVTMVAMCVYIVYSFIDTERCLLMICRLIPP